MRTAVTKVRGHPHAVFGAIGFDKQIITLTFKCCGSRFRPGEAEKFSIPFAAAALNRIMTVARGKKVGITVTPASHVVIACTAL